MKNEKGFSLIEVMLAIALLGIIAIAFLGALSTASKALFIADERATAESLARSQMEYVKNQEYDADNDPPQYELNEDIIPAGYDIAGYDYDINVFKAERLDKGDGIATDTGIQKITIIVYHHNNPIITSGDFTLEGYKVDR